MDHYAIPIPALVCSIELFFFNISVNDPVNILKYSLVLKKNYVSILQFLSIPLSMTKLTDGLMTRPILNQNMK